VLFFLLIHSIISEFHDLIQRAAFRARCQTN
jgi:hypothetical protein